MTDENDQLGLTDDNLGAVDEEMFDDDILSGLSQEEINQAAVKWIQSERSLKETNPAFLLNVNNALAQFNFPIFAASNLTDVEERERQALALLLAGEFDMIKRLAFEPAGEGLSAVLSAYESIAFNTIFHNMLLNRQVHGAIIALHAAGMVENIQTLVANLQEKSSETDDVKPSE